jgi:Tfp pilus assembly protein PilO
MKRSGGPLMKIDAAGALLALAVLTGIAMIAVAPVLSERGLASERRVELDALERETETALATLRTAARRLADGKSKAETLPAHLRTRQDRNSRIAEIVGQAEAEGMELLSILPGETAVGDRYARTPIEMSMRGEFAALVGYLHAIHESSQDLEITNLEIRRKTDSAAIETVIRAEWITLTD